MGSGRKICIGEMNVNCVGVDVSKSAHDQNRTYLYKVTKYYTSLKCISKKSD